VKFSTRDLGWETDETCLIICQSGLD